MSLYKYPQVLVQTNDAAFDQIQGPGASTPHSGIYRCEGCGKEISANQGNPLPPQNHHQHGSGQGTIRWRLIVYAQ
jgi:hypothetical protein